MARTTLEQLVNEKDYERENMSPLVRDLFDRARYSPITYYTPKTNEETGKSFKSNGERNIAGFLTEQKLGFAYEMPFLLKEEDGFFHTRRPDFYVKELDLVIEYNGTSSEKERYENKEEKYLMNRVNYINISSSQMSSGEWKSILLKRIEVEKTKTIDERINEPIASIKEPNGCGSYVLACIAAIGGVVGAVYYALNNL